MAEKEILAEEYQRLIDFCRKYRLKDYEAKLKDKLEDLFSPLKVMIVGEGKSGKSSLLNALVGVEAAEVDDEPKTWCINLYTRTAGEPYAELIYRDKSERVTPEEAHEVSRRISDAESMDTLSEKDRSLQEIRWYLNLPWPERDIFIVDTPGVNQIRKDPSAEEFSFQIGEGIRFVANDGFDKYYYKADLVLWCFCADSVNDREVEEHLKSVTGQGKRIYGIITKLDREETESGREKLFAANENRYRKYHLSACIRSMLPPIYEDDDEKAAAEKKLQREATVTGIRSVIRCLLEDNGADEIKMESSENYLSAIRENIALSMAELLDFYCTNYDNAKNAWNDLVTEGQSWRQKVIQDLEAAGFADRGRFSDPGYFSELWERSQANSNTFASMISEGISSCALSTGGKRTFRTYQNSISDVTKHLLERIKWKTVTVNLYGTGQDSVSAELNPEPAVFFIPEKSAGGVSDREQMGLRYHITQFFGRESFNGHLINALTGDVIRERAVNAGIVASLQSVDALLANYKAAADEVLQEADQRYHAILLERFEELNGCAMDRLPEKVIELEQDLLKIEAFRAGELVYYPQGSSGQLSFFASCFSRRFDREPTCSEEELCRVFGELFDAVFSERRKTEENIMLSAIGTYQGREGVERPQISHRYGPMKDDEEVLRFLPALEQIEWYGEEETIGELYLDKQQEYTLACKKFWKEQSDRVQKRVLQERLDEIERSFRPEFDYFCKAWKQQALMDIDWFHNSQCYTMLPPNMDYSRYYFQVYLNIRRGDVLIGQILKYTNRKELPWGWEQRYQVIGVAGKPLEAEVKTMIGDFLKKKETELLLLRREIGEKKWDEGIREIEDYGYRVCDGYLYSIDMFLKQNVTEAWDAYQAAPQGGTRIPNILEYAVKSGKLPEKLRGVLAGNVPELAMYGNVLCGDGTRLMLRWKNYIKDELGGYLEKWK